ncbi:hypothetical protein W97_02408 [Coniosporium apollinis CBS 100218]|uniref:Uncharacterized protein n=1 Tax=Coniosporium apollinis (strain CBS 100218) TaxID=1168221 RepID=R7YNH2_CONA1|nr:uncharacterized protein W97_02408 [Coniosporium apollinis CBS 100218]EON63181.1 hypothetical protein W97_02408 [Coniosporium apollinis CBS 100218]
MASYKSHFNPPMRQEAQPPPSRPQQNSFTRLPTRSITPTIATTHSPTSSAPNKLSRKGESKDEHSSIMRAATSHKASVSRSGALAEPRRTGSRIPSPSPHALSGVSFTKTIPPPSAARSTRFEDTRTPSLVSGSSASTVDSFRSGALRKRSSLVGRQVPRQALGSISSLEGAEHQSKSLPGGYRDLFHGDVLGISLPPPSTSMARSLAGHVNSTSQDVALHLPYPLLTENLPPQTPSYALSASPATRYSDSPGVFSHASTPTSMSSYSPGVVAQPKTAPRARQPSPLESRPPVTRRRLEDNKLLKEPDGLPSLRESSTSSSSGSTVKVSSYTQQSTKSKPAPRTQLESTDKTQKSFLAAPQTRSNPGITQKSNPSGHVDGTTTIYPPPELAHLVDASGQKPTYSRPRRPSRDGIPTLLSAREPSPIVQSNLASLPITSHRRQTSAEFRSATAPGFTSNSRGRFAMPSKLPSRNPSPSPSLSSSLPQAQSRLLRRQPTPDVQTNSEPKARKEQPPTTASPSKFTSRFGFFSRKAKAEPAPPLVSVNKKLRKGPAAGTGHEGYGKYSLRGRSGSSTTVSSGRSTSADSSGGSLGRSVSTRKSSMGSKGEPPLDHFIAERLTPVILRGEGVVQASESSSGGYFGDRPSLDTTTYSTAPAPYTAQKPTLLPSAMSDSVRSMSPVKKAPLTRSPSDSSDQSFQLPTIAARRSFRKSQLNNSQAPRMPTPINTTLAPLAPSMSSSANQYSFPETDTTLPLSDVSEGKEGNWMKFKKATGQSVFSKKWNFFQRASSPRTEPSPEPVIETVPVEVSHQPAPRSVAHYAIAEPADHIDMEELEKIMQEADDDCSSVEQFPSYRQPEPLAKRLEYVQSMLLPPCPVLPPDTQLPVRAASPTVFLQRDNSATFEPSSVQIHSTTTEVPPPSAAIPPADTLLQPIASPHRPSRLQQVGRIPQVVSKRDRDRRLPSNSFSRPFVASRPRPTVQPPETTTVAKRESTTLSGFQPVVDTARIPDGRPVRLSNHAIGNSTNAVPDGASTPDINATSEFFSFPPRKDSQISYSSSSVFSSFPASTAILPTAAAPLSEDEVWGEYDDLIDDVLSPLYTMTTEGASFPFGSTAVEQKNALNPLPQPLKISTNADHTRAGSGSSSTQTSANVLRRSRLLMALQTSGTPTTPMSLGDFFAGYGDRNLSILDPVSGRLSLPATSRASSGSARPTSIRSSLPASLAQSTSRHSKSSSVPGVSTPANRYRDTRLMEIAETQNDGLASMANLRFGALMTSKWLSFGRVLFSPAHFELKDKNEDRVLVIDGLGKDWSYYCALTYSTATIYNLGPNPTDAPKDLNQWQSLPNHRHIHHSSIESPFPFPKGFFAAVVFRFPVATSEAAYRAAIFECKRVLRPGGYLEISVLDLDLLNMGNRARRAVRALKVKMQVADPAVSLKPMSDNLQHILGRRGFENLNRCMVGIPAAGKIRDSSDGTQQEPDTNFTDLLRDKSGGDADSDEGITKMVARVGRWWYSRCYESAVLPNGDLKESIWADEALVRECEKRATSFRLLICYAQKPAVLVRRTVSV